METTFYDGCSKTFTIEWSCETLVQVYNDVKETGEAVMEECKIQTFLRQLNDPRYEAAKNTN